MKFSIIKHQTFNPHIVQLIIGFSLGVWGLRIGVSASFATEPELISAKQGPHKFSPADSSKPALSDDGMVVAFESLARLTPDDKDRNKDVYVFNRREKTLRLMQGANQSYSNAGAALSGDGRVLAFHSVRRPFQKNVSPSNADIIWQRIDDGRPILLTRGFDGQPQEGEAMYPLLNVDGERVLFTSNASNLTSAKKIPVRAVYLIDRSSEDPQLVSQSDDNQPANRTSGCPRMSVDGGTVAFLSAATNLDPGLSLDSLGMHLYLRDMKSGKNTRLDVFEKSFDANEWVLVTFDMDAAGQVLVFEARHRNIEDPFKSLTATDLFIYDRAVDQVQLLTTSIFANRCRTPSMSADARYVAFILRMDKATNDKDGLVIYDRSHGTWRRIVDGACTNPVISKDGSVVAFEKKEKTITHVYVIANPFAQENDAGH